MQTILDLGAVLVFLLAVSSVAWAVRKEEKDAPTILTAFVAFFAILFGIVFMSAASQLATGKSSTQAVLLVFFVVIAALTKFVWSSSPA